MCWLAAYITVAGSIFALYKVIVELSHSKKPQLREEYKFVKEFMAELNSDTHPYLVEKGYRAITGDATLGAPEIRYLLSLASPGLGLRRYSSARALLNFIPNLSESGKAVIFKENYSSYTKRNWLKRWYVLLYGIFAALAFFPLIFVQEIWIASGSAGLVVVAMARLAFIPLALISLFSYGRILQAEELVDQQ